MDTSASKSPNRFTPELWALIRQLWEGSALSYAKAADQAGQQMGCPVPSKATVTQRATREGWVRGGVADAPVNAPEPTPAKPKVEKRHPNGRKPNRAEKPETDSTVSQVMAEVLATTDGLLAKLTDKQRLFSLEYLHDLNATSAYMRAFKTSNAKTAGTEGYRLLKNPDVMAFVGAKIRERAERCETDADMVVLAWRDTATADPNDICEYRRECCRYCYGINHRYQYTPAELEDAQKEHEDRRQEKLAATEGKLDIGDFDERGGVGFNATLDPNPDCPECFGEGVGRAHFKDTRKLSAAARALYGGVEIGKDGLKVKIHARDHALDQLARHNQMFVEKVEVSGSAFDVTALEARFGAAMSEAHKRMEKMREDRKAQDE